jgi:hypothetical protein
MLLLAASSPPPVDGDSVEVSGPSAALFLQYRLLARDVLARSCRYEPSCSHYAEEAVDSLGLLLGLPMGLERWTRCHGGAGEDGLYPRGPGGLLRDPPFRREEGGDPTWSSLALPF